MMKAFPIWCLELVHARRQNNWIAFISENLNYLLTVYFDCCKSPLIINVSFLKTSLKIVTQPSYIYFTATKQTRYFDDVNLALCYSMNSYYMNMIPMDMMCYHWLMYQK